MDAKGHPKGQKNEDETRTKFKSGFKQQHVILNDSPMKIDDFCISAPLLEPLRAVLGAFGQLLGGFYERQNRYCVRGASSLTRRSGHGWILEAFWNQK